MTASREGAAAGFAARLHARRRRLGTAVCLGLDPRPAAHPLTDPARLGAADPWHDEVLSAVLDYCQAILDATHDVIAACKPQAAFFEALGPGGIQVLSQVMARARDLDVPVILDAKRGDIGATAAAYAAAYLTDGPLVADALTVSPYLGLDTLEPFVSAAVANSKAIYVLVRTSNPGSRDLQGLELKGGASVAGHLARRLAAMAQALPADEDGYTCLGAVAGDARSMAAVRAALPLSPLLVPGYGAQGSAAREVVPAFDGSGLGAVVNASRTLTYGTGFDQAVSFAEVGQRARAAAIRMRDDIEAALGPEIRVSAGTT